MIGRLAIGFLFIILSILSLIYIDEKILTILGINPYLITLKSVFGIILFFVGLYFLLSIKKV